MRVTLRRLILYPITVHTYISAIVSLQQRVFYADVVHCRSELRVD
jgi:hypothetical protein